MNSRFLGLIWLALAVGVVGFGLAAAPALTTESSLAATAWMLPVMLVVAILTALTLLTPRRPLRPAAAALRARPALYWLLLLAYVTYTLGYWLDHEQPTYGRWLTAVEACYLCAIAWGLLLLLAYDLDSARELGARLGKSRLSGVLVTLTTAVVIFFGAEGYLRLFYVTTDAYGFTAMNYHWYNNFLWGRYNSMGYRDHEPLPDPVTRLAVVGDSFAVGHGINNIDDTFPQLLEKDLGGGYDVNLVATSGWDSDVEAGYLNAYYATLGVSAPRYVILSYYLNDITYLLKNDPALAPDAAFDFPRTEWFGWFIRQYFTPNYIYYILLQYTSPARNINFVERLINAHLDDGLWMQQAAALQQMVAWCREREAQLIVLLWPHLLAINESQPAVERVKGFFEGQGAAVVDMTGPLEAMPPGERVLNRFDSHPSIAANRAAAAALLEAIRR